MSRKVMIVFDVDEQDTPPWHFSGVGLTDDELWTLGESIAMNADVEPCCLTLDEILVVTKP